jgi:hypothetical protein
MIRLQIPYRSVLLEPRELDPADFDALCREHLEASRAAPVVIEIASGDIQYLLFLNEGQLYWAGAHDGERVRAVPLREFFARLRRLQFPQMVAYRIDLALFHALLVWGQKKPDLKVASTLVDIDELLDRMGTDSANAVLTARDRAELIVLRCQGGTPAVCHRGRRDSARDGHDAREDFLVAVYTISAKHPLELNLFTDLSVTHAEDVRSIPAGFAGSIASFFLSQPPRLVVRLKGRPLKAYAFSGPEVTIGRLPDNDVVIDNLSVSRSHAAVASCGDGYVVRDLASKNGTMLNGAPVTSARLADGDVISIGKYDILFQIPTLEGAAPGELDQTIIVPQFHGSTPPRPDASRGAGPRPEPRLFRKSAMDEFPLEKERTVIGRAKDADIRLRGFFAPRVRVEIVRAGDDYVLRARGSGRVRINGEETDEKALEREDLITIGAEEFVFKE